MTLLRFPDMLWAWWSLPGCRRRLFVVVKTSVPVNFIYTNPTFIYTNPTLIHTNWLDLWMTFDTGGSPQMLHNTSGVLPCKVAASLWVTSTCACLCTNTLIQNLVEGPPLEVVFVVGFHLAWFGVYFDTLGHHFGTLGSLDTIFGKNSVPGIFLY